MSVKFIQKVLFVAIVLIVGSQFLEWLARIAGQAWGLVGGLLSVAVYVFCYYKARASVKETAKAFLWIFVPTVAFTVVPMGIWIYRFSHREQQSALVLIWQAIPLIFSFVIPVILLVFVHYSLSKLAQHTDNAKQ
jgi:hypothetical protein